MSKKHKIFISYNHADIAILERVQIHLKPLEKMNLIDIWDDTRIKAGEKWKDEVEKALEQASIAILLISADFLASDFIVENELPFPPPRVTIAKVYFTFINSIFFKNSYTIVGISPKWQGKINPIHPVSGSILSSINNFGIEKISELSILFLSSFATNKELPVPEK